MIEIFNSNLLKKLREMSGLSQNELAKLVGASSGQIVSRWERGEAIPERRFIRALSREFGVDENDFFKVVADEN